MVLIPNLNDYDINVLIALGDSTSDEFSRGRIRGAIVEKILQFNYPFFFLIKKFMYSKTILKEAYADAVLINMKGNDYVIEDVLVDEILTYASLDVLMHYGADSKLFEFNRKCKDEFYKRGRELEDKLEFQRKKNLEKGVINFKRKGDKNDKY